MTWSDYAQFAVAVATLILAGGTAWMAKETREVGKQTRAEALAVAEEVAIAREQVEASNRQASSAQAALEASIRPWLTIVQPERPLPGRSLPLSVLTSHLPRVQHNNTNQLVVSFGLRNVGNGIALLQQAVLRGRERRTSTLIDYPWKAFFSVPVLQPQEQTRITFRGQLQADFPRTLDELVGRPAVWGELYVDVLYADVGGAQETWATVHITATSETAEAWCVHAIDYRNTRDEDSFAHIEFDS